METLITTYKEFYDVTEAENAVRALHEAGFEKVETYDLSPHMHEIDDVGSPQKRKRWTYYAGGLGLGALTGASLGTVLFYVPSTLLEMNHALYIMVIGVGACTFFGGLIGLQEACIMAKRLSCEPTSSNGSRSVGVQVLSRDCSRLRDAKQILSRFGERPAWALS